MASNLVTYDLDIDNLNLEEIDFDEDIPLDENVLKDDKEEKVKPVLKK